MIKLFSINFRKTYFFLKAYEQWILGFILLLFLILNALIVYRYIYLATNQKSELGFEKTEINQEILDKILKETKERRETLSRALKTQYPDLFR